MTNTNKITTRDLTYIAICTSLMAICSWIVIPFGAVPFTMQTFGVFIALNLLGGKKGSLSIMVYIFMGIIGLPVFAGFGGGLSSLLGPTGGYIWGFLAQGLVYFAAEKVLPKSKLNDIIASVLGLAACYMLGTIWFVNVYSANVGAIGYGSALMMCVVPFIIPDLTKLLLSVVVCKAIKPQIMREYSR